MYKHLSNVFLKCILLGFCINKARGLFCYNCSTTHRQKEHCAGDFATPGFYFNSSKKFLQNCTGEKAMCFVRSWSARAKHAWIIQRGCYEVQEEDPLPQALSIPKRAMTCKHERLTNAEYKVCLCRADWCNAAPPRIVQTTSIKNGMWTWVYVFSMGYL